MKINIIQTDKSNNVMMDAELLSYIFKRLKQKPTVSHIHVNSYKLEEATVNIFLENINYYQLSKAKYNIFVPNFHYFHKNWTELAKNFDLIICKTQYCYDIFKDLVDQTKLVNIGWRSPDFSMPNIDKEYEDYMVLYNDAYFNDLQKILNVWKIDYPTLNVVFNGVNNTSIKRVNLANINYIENITPEKFELLFNKCIVHFCLDTIDNFNHSIVQCQLVKSVPVVLNKGPSQEIVDTDNCFMVSSNKKKNKGSFGSVYRYTEEELDYTLQKIINTKPDILDIMGKNCCIFSTKNQNIFLDKITKLFNDVFEKTKKIKFNRTEYTLEDLPSISIVTPVYNLPDIFNIAVLNYTSTKYLKHKTQWIIVDDSDEGKDVESLLPQKQNRDKFNIKYIRLDAKTDLYQKYNIGVKLASNEVIVNMTPDDFIYEGGLPLLVKSLLKSEKKCVGMTQYGCFEINRYISMINVNYPTLPYYLRVYEGSLCYYKSFWEEQNYGEESLQAFIEGRLNQFDEINWADILVGLVHTRNSDKRIVDSKQEPNGCHFKFTEKLFKYVCSLDKQKIEENEKRNKEIEEIRKAADEADEETTTKINTMDTIEEGVGEQTNKQQENEPKIKEI